MCNAGQGNNLGTCMNGSCQRGGGDAGAELCGAIMQPCCGNNFNRTCTAPNARCNNMGANSTCEACGSQGQQCCGNGIGVNTCLTGLECLAGGANPDGGGGGGGGGARTCQPCGGDGQRCCGGNNGTCSAGLGCDNPPGFNMPSTCKACGALNGACCGGANCQEGGLCVGAVNGAGGTCQPCGGTGERCCGGPQAPNTCTAGLICQGQGATQACVAPPPCGDAGQPCCGTGNIGNRTCNGGGLVCRFMGGAPRCVAGGGGGNDAGAGVNCGAVGQPCCAGVRCNTADLECDQQANSCLPCGGELQRCCGNGQIAQQTCTAGLTCRLQMGTARCFGGGADAGP
jgi:hypothetical protein